MRAECRKRFTLRIGTIFAESRVSRRTWLQAVHLMVSGKKGISSQKLCRVPNITHASAGLMSHRKAAEDRSPCRHIKALMPRLPLPPYGSARQVAMGRSVKPADDIMALVRREADLHSRPVAGQITHRLRIGRAFGHSGRFDHVRITAVLKASSTRPG